MAQITAIPPARGVAGDWGADDAGVLANAGAGDRAAGDRGPGDARAGDRGAGDCAAPLRILLSPPDVGEREREALSWNMDPDLLDDGT
jgi:hypothetical protein